MYLLKWAVNASFFLFTALLHLALRQQPNERHLMRGKKKPHPLHYLPGELHASNAQTSSEPMIFIHRIIFCFACVCPSVCVCRGCKTRLPPAKVTCQHQRKALTVATKQHIANRLIFEQLPLQHVEQRDSGRKQRHS